jgi:hypothetical protein
MRALSQVRGRECLLDSPSGHCMSSSGGLLCCQAPAFAALGAQQAAFQTLHAPSSASFLGWGKLQLWQPPGQCRIQATFGGAGLCTCLALPGTTAAGSARGPLCPASSSACAVAKITCSLRHMHAAWAAAGRSALPDIARASFFVCTACSHVLSAPWGSPAASTAPSLLRQAFGLARWLHAAPMMCERLCESVFC